MKKGRENFGLKNIFRIMMEEGFYPTFEKDHILFESGDNLVMTEYQSGILAVRLFFSIEEDTYEMFLEASNNTMSNTVNVKPAILDDRRTLMFSCETMCDNAREFRKFFPRSLTFLNEALEYHKSEMKVLLHQSMLYQDLNTDKNQNRPSKKLCS